MILEEYCVLENSDKNYRRKFDNDILSSYNSSRRKIMEKKRKREEAARL